MCYRHYYYYSLLVLTSEYGTMILVCNRNVGFILLKPQQPQDFGFGPGMHKDLKCQAAAEEEAWSNGQIKNTKYPS